MNTLMILLGLALWLILSMLVFAMLDICAMLRQPQPRIRFVDERGNEIVLDDLGPLHYDEIDQLVDRYFREMDDDTAPLTVENLASDGLLTAYKAPYEA